MERRTALKSIGLGLGIAFSIPSWAKNWEKTQFNFTGNEMIAELVSAIIPEGDEPGAKSLGVHLFVERMIKDCYPSEVSQFFNDNLIKIDMMAEELKKKSFKAISQSDKLELLKLFEDSILEEDSNFYALLKQLTIQGYTNSEYFLTKYRNYEMAPGYFHGCVNV